MSTLITGGAGFIGSNLVEELLKVGEDIVVLDNMQTGKAYTFNQTVEILNKNMGLTMKAQHVANPIKNYVQHTLSDTAKTEKVLGFKARYDLEEGIKELLRFYAK